MFRLFGGERRRIEPGVVLVAARRALQDAQDEPALLQAVVDAMGPQIVFHPHVSCVPRLGCAGRRLKRGQRSAHGFQR
jgi:hypothetical protein